MTEEMLIFDKVAKILRQQENYVPREYKTVGGMWTVDTYKIGDTTLQLMDEGWTTRIFNDAISITDRGGKLIFEKGSLVDLKLLLLSFN